MRGLVRPFCFTAGALRVGGLPRGGVLPAGGQGEGGGAAHQPAHGPDQGRRGQGAAGGECLMHAVGLFQLWAGFRSDAHDRAALFTAVLQLCWPPPLFGLLPRLPLGDADAARRQGQPRAVSVWSSSSGLV